MPRPRKITLENATGEDRWQLPVLTEEEVRGLPASVELVYAARALGFGRTQARECARSLGHLDFGGRQLPVMKVGKVWRCRKADLMAVLGLTEHATAGTGAVA